MSADMQLLQKNPDQPRECAKLNSLAPKLLLTSQSPDRESPLRPGLGANTGRSSSCCRSGRNMAIPATPHTSGSRKIMTDLDQVFTHLNRHVTKLRQKYADLSNAIV